MSFIRYEFLSRELINSTLTYVPSLKPMYLNITRTDKYRKLKAMLVYSIMYTHSISLHTYMYTYIFTYACPFCRNVNVLKNIQGVSDERNAIQYYDAMHNFTDDLRILQKALRHKIK